MSELSYSDNELGSKINLNQWKLLCLEAK